MISFCPFDNIYGDDFSLINIKNKTITNCEYKDCYFIGTFFDNVIFNKC